MELIADITSTRAAALKRDADAIRSIADRYERGELIEIAIVCNDRAGGHFESFGVFTDRWRMLGAIEYAKHHVMSS